MFERPSNWLGDQWQRMGFCIKDLDDSSLQEQAGHSLEHTLRSCTSRKDAKQALKVLLTGPSSRGPPLPVTLHLLARLGNSLTDGVSRTDNRAHDLQASNSAPAQLASGGADWLPA